MTPRPALRPPTASAHASDTSAANQNTMAQMHKPICVAASSAHSTNANTRNADRVNVNMRGRREGGGGGGAHLVWAREATARARAEPTG